MFLNPNQRRFPIYGYYIAKRHKRSLANILGSEFILGRFRLKDTFFGFFSLVAFQERFGKTGRQKF
jgi:hypothetical protein